VSCVLCPYTAQPPSPGTCLPTLTCLHSPSHLHRHPLICCTPVPIHSSSTIRPGRLHRCGGHRGAAAGDVHSRLSSVQGTRCAHRYALNPLLCDECVLTPFLCDGCVLNLPLLCDDSVLTPPLLCDDFVLNPPLPCDDYVLNPLTGDEQVRASELWGGKKIHSTHGVHPAGMYVAPSV
jgi:hypothetical protein